VRGSDLRLLRAARQHRHHPAERLLQTAFRLDCHATLLRALGSWSSVHLPLLFRNSHVTGAVKISKSRCLLMMRARRNITSSSKPENSANESHSESVLNFTIP
jgi:hypothetical protein